VSFIYGLVLVQLNCCVLARDLWSASELGPFRCEITFYGFWLPGGSQLVECFFLEKQKKEQIFLFL